MNPFGITEVSLPQIYGAVNENRMSRIQQMIGQQQVRTAEAALDRQNNIQRVLAGAFGRGQPSAQAGGQSRPMGGAYANPVTQSPQEYGQSIAAAATPAPAAAPRTGSTLSPETQAQLLAIDPEQGGQIVQAFRQMDTAQMERINAANGYLANFAMYLSGIPMAQRQAEIQRRAPDLVAHGISQEQIAGFTPDDNNLRYVITSARDLEHLAAEARDTFTEVGGEVLSNNALRQRRPDERGVVFSSPYIPTPEGLAARPGPGAPAAPARPPQVAPGTTESYNGRNYRLNQSGQWEDIGPATGDAPAFRPGPGGAGSGQQGFR